MGQLLLQRWHTESFTAPSTVEYVPTAHGWHAWEATADENVPAKQGVHTTLCGLLAYVPGLQSWQAVEPSVEYVPAVHGWHATVPYMPALQVWKTNTVSGYCVRMSTWNRECVGRLYVHKQANSLLLVGSTYLADVIAAAPSCCNTRRTAHQWVVSHINVTVLWQ